jgi:hypothetical protein
VTSRSRREETLRQRWIEVLRAELVRRGEEEDEEGGERREQAIAALAAELRATAERLAVTEDGYPLLEDASVMQRLAVVTYLPHRLSAAELEAESAALNAWFEEYGRRGRG